MQLYYDLDFFDPCVQMLELA